MLFEQQSDRGRLQLRQEQMHRKNCKSLILPSNLALFSIHGPLELLLFYSGRPNDPAMKAVQQMDG